MEKIGISHAPEGGLPFTYYLTTPTGFDPAKESLPMIVFLHGAGERGEDIQKVLRHGIPKYFSADNDYRGLRVLTLSPQCPADMVWSNMVRDVKRVIDEVAAENNVDLSRISITGLSMGGFGTWDMICSYPEMFCAAGPICGGGLGWRAGEMVDRLPPVQAYHGDADTVVPLWYSTSMVDAIRAGGGSAELTIFRGIGHNSWERAYEKTDLIEFLSGAKR